jgi:hypothetical protein
MKEKQNLLALSLLISTALVSSRLVVYGPTALKDKFEFQGIVHKRSNKFSSIDHKIRANYANFGNIPYGQSMVGTRACR